MVSLSLSTKMSEYGPDVQGGGVSTPLHEYTASVSEGFPRVGRGRMVESSILGRSKIDILPVNLDGRNDGITDTYIEFRIPGISGQFLDLSTLTLELYVSVTKTDGSKLGEDDHMIFANGLSNTMFKTCACYFNEQLVESNALFNYHSFLKMVTTLSQDKVDSIGNNAFFYRDYEGESGIVDKFTDTFFTSASKYEKDLITSCKTHGLSMTAPLLCDVSSLDAYLLDSVDVRLRLELANKSWIINSHQSADNFRFKLDSAKLWVDRVTPHSTALESLNHSMMIKPLQYTYNRSLYKTFILPANQTSLIGELPFAQIIPQNLTMCIVDMEGLQGSCARNGLFFQHANLSEVLITINGSTVYNIHSSFPHHASRLFYNTMESLGLETHNNLTLNSFKNGRTVCVFNFISEDVQNAIPLEKSGNLRINLGFNKGVDRNLVVLLFADTTGVIQIDSQRHVRCIVRA